MSTFIVIGDWGRRGTNGQRAVARAMARVARRQGCRFVLTTGDNFYDAGVQSASDPHWQESFERVYADPALRVPWYVALGNHDHSGNALAQVEYGRRNPRWVLPDLSYATTLGMGGTSLLLVVLDTTPFLARYAADGLEPIDALAGLSPEPQVGWLRRTLALSTAQWKIVVGHHPILSGSPFHGGAAELAARVRPLLTEHGVHAYISGHEHDLQHLIQGSLHYFVSGAGSETRSTGVIPSTQFALGEPGFLRVEVSRERLAFSFVDVRGEVVYEAEEPAELAARREEH